MTDAAQAKIKSLLHKRQTPNDYLRISLLGGGCSGFTYHYEFVSNTDQTDKVFEFEDIKVCIDKKSYLFLNGMEIDYEEDLFKSGLVFNSPKAKRTCGCGESVSF
tara:strand:- start:176 stop:490 length:315 start_codon:yes stop_codon:yes gene_type:complete